MDTIDRVPQIGEKGIYLKQQLKDKLIAHKRAAPTRTHGDEAAAQSSIGQPVFCSPPTMPSSRSKVAALGKDSPPEARRPLEGLRSPFGTIAVGHVNARPAPAFQF